MAGRTPPDSVTRLRPDTCEATYDGHVCKLAWGHSGQHFDGVGGAGVTWIGEEDVEVDLSVTTYVTEQDQIIAVQPGEHELRDNFNRFHEQNPRVYEILVRLAREWREARPGSRCGIGALFERARWDLAIRTRGEPLKLNNNYRAFYSRLIMEREPDLVDIFKTRRQRG